MNQVAERSMHDEFLQTYDRSEDFLDAFVAKYARLLDPISYNGQLDWRSTASMLTILGAEYGIQGDPGKAMALLDNALRAVEHGCERSGGRVIDEDTYLNAVWFKAMVHQNTGEYRRALRLFNFCNNHGPEELKLKCERSIALCKWKLRNRAALWWLLLGVALSILVVFLYLNGTGPLAIVYLSVCAVVALLGFVYRYKRRFKG